MSEYTVTATTTLVRIGAGHAVHMIDRADDGTVLGTLCGNRRPGALTPINDNVPVTCQRCGGRLAAEAERDADATTPAREAHADEEVRVAPEREHVVLVAVTVRASGRRAAQGQVRETLDAARHAGQVDSWWVAEDDRQDGSDTDSAVFVRPGVQRQARAVLAQVGGLTEEVPEGTDPLAGTLTGALYAWHESDDRDPEVMEDLLGDVVTTLREGYVLADPTTTHPDAD